MHDATRIPERPTSPATAGRDPATAIAQLDPEQQAIGLWLKRKSPNTARGYARCLNQFKSFFEAKPLSAATPDDLESFLDHLETLPLSGGSKLYTVSAVKSFFKFAARRKFMPYDIGSMIKMEGEKEQLNERIVEADVAWGLIDAAYGLGAGEYASKSFRNGLIVEMLYVTGARRSELVRLTWEDAIPRSGVDGIGGQITLFGKGRKTRTVPVLASTWGKLAQMRSLIAGDGEAGQRAVAKRRIFPITADQVWRIVKKTAIGAGITKEISPHWLRHCFCSHALDNGASLSLIQRDAGHANIATTSKYLSARPKDGASSYLKRKGR